MIPFQRSGLLLGLLSAPAMVIAGGSVLAEVTLNGRTALVAGHSLVLTEDDGQCRLIRAGAGQDQALLLSPPCAFHRDPDGGLRVLQQGAVRYLLIESSRSLNTSGPDCDTQLQSVRIIGARVDVSPVRSRVAACPPFQWDAKVFTGLFPDGAR